MWPMQTYVLVFRYLNQENGLVEREIHNEGLAAFVGLRR